MASKIADREEYFKFAQQHLVIDEDCNGSFAMVPSENSDKSYKVEIDESETVPHASDCTCPHRFNRNAYCKHMQVVDRFYNKIYAWHIAKQQNNSIEAAMEIAQEEMLQADRDIDHNAYEILAETKHQHCPGCGGAYDGKAKNCSVGRCYWNSWYNTAA